jgi:hypothetical protein
MTGKTDANYLSLFAHPIGRLLQIPRGRQLFIHSIRPLHATIGKREMSRVSKVSGPFAALYVVAAVTSACARLLVSSTAIYCACNNSYRSLDASEPFGFFSLNRRGRRKQHGAPPERVAGRANPSTCCKRLPAGTALKRYRLAIRRPIWRAVRGGLRTRRHSMCPGLQPAPSATPLPRGGAVKYSHGGRRHDHSQDSAIPCR